MTRKKRIENDEQYQKAIKWLTDAALELEEDPSLVGEQREKKMLIYEATSEAIAVYNAEVFSAVCPYLRLLYQELGLIDKEGG